jgi:hypothetical protein
MRKDVKYSTSFGNINYCATTTLIGGASVTFYSCATRRQRAPHIRGICADAATLGVHRCHLWFVLTGRRESKPLMRRYRALKEQQARTAKA